MEKVLMRADGFPMRHEDIYRELGVEGRYLPDAGIPSKVIQGIEVMVVAKTPGVAQDGNRTFALCPKCNHWFGFARLRQHMKVHR